MRKHFIKSSFVAGLLSLLFSFSALRVGSITDITKPYLGEYECKSAVYGNKDILDDLSYVVLELLPDNTFVVRYKTKKGTPKEETGEYEYDKENKTIRFSLGGKNEIKRDFSLENGELSVSLKLGWNTLYLQFEQK